MFVNSGCVTSDIKQTAEEGSMKLLQPDVLSRSGCLYPARRHAPLGGIGL